MARVRAVNEKNRAENISSKLFVYDNIKINMEGYRYD